MLGASQAVGSEGPREEQEAPCGAGWGMCWVVFAQDPWGGDAGRSRGLRDFGGGEETPVDTQ